MTHPEAARVAGLFRYPVKSLAGEPLPSAELSWHGIRGDRRWAFLRADSADSGFPWWTIREQPRMCRYRPRLTDPADPDRSGVEVTTPDGRVLAVDAPELAAELGEGVSVMRLKRGLFDSMPLSLIGTATVAELCRRGGVATDPLRFRPNLLVETDTPFAEDSWVGSVLRIGEAEVRVDRHDVRCVMLDVDPVTGAPSGRVLKGIGADRQACAGLYGSTVVPGTVSLGDPVRPAAADPAAVTGAGTERQRVET